MTKKKNLAGEQLLCDELTIQYDSKTEFSGQIILPLCVWQSDFPKA